MFKKGKPQDWGYFFYYLCKNLTFKQIMNGKPSLNYHDPWDTLHFEFVEDAGYPQKE